MLEHEASRLSHPDAAWGFEDWKGTPKRAYAYYGPAVRTAWIEACEWLIARQLDWGNLTASESIEELRKGAQSVFYPLFADDPRVVLDCPLNGRVSIGPEGYCDSCGYDWSN